MSVWCCLMSVWMLRPKSELLHAASWSFRCTALGRTSRIPSQHFCYGKFHIGKFYIRYLFYRIGDFPIFWKSSKSKIWKFLCCCFPDVRNHFPKSRHSEIPKSGLLDFGKFGVSKKEIWHQQELRGWCPLQRLDRQMQWKSSKGMKVGKSANAINTRIHNRLFSSKIRSERTCTW